MKGIIYKLTSPSGRSYVGLTKQSLEQRLHRHKSEVRARPISNAIKKYGLDSFVVEILHECHHACLGALEQLEIARHNTIVPNGYNQTIGGERSMLGYRHTDEARSKMSASHKGKKLSDAHKQSISDWSTNYWSNPDNRERVSKTLRGREFSDEHKSKISKSMKGHSVSQKTRDAVAESNRRRRGEKRKRQHSPNQLKLF